MDVWSEYESPLGKLWSLVYSVCGGDFYIYYCIVSPIIGILALLMVNLPFAFLDLTGRPQALLKYKIQEEKPVPVNWEMYKKMMKGTLFNAIVMSPIFQHITYPLVVWRGSEFTADLPSFTTTLWHLLIALVFVEVGFYYSHRLFHHPLLYRSIHKMHHEWVSPVAMCSIYCHPLEYIVCNLAPVVMGPIIAGSHASIGLLWYIVVIVVTSIHHSGYHFPLLPSSESHDYHHAKFNQCYGVLGILDFLHGTNMQFRSSKAYDRHTLLIGPTPANVLYPDSPRKNKK